jgi:hypothetical protein
VFGFPALEAVILNKATSLSSGAIFSITRHIDALLDHIVPAYLFSPTTPCVYG